MFDTLMALPLFQGLGREDLTRIVESTRLDFRTLKAGMTFITQGSSCDGLTFVMDGTVCMSTDAADSRWRVEELLAAPLVIGTEVLYGRTRWHLHSYRTEQQVHLLDVDKRTVGALTAYFEVFRLNLLNLLTTGIVKHEQQNWLPPSASLEGRIITFLRRHVMRPAGEKRFHISLPLLGAYLGQDPRYVSKALHRLENRGVVELSRRLIVIPKFEKLVQ